MDPKRQEKRERRATWAVAVKARDNGFCQRYEPIEPRGRVWFGCTKKATDAHHMLARSQGGTDELWNGLGLCHEHHMWCHDHRIEAQALGLLAHIGDCSELPEED